MRKTSAKYLLRAWLIIAIVSGQWYSMHYHLSETHAHDSELHHHSISAHSHQFDGHLADAIDVADDHGQHLAVQIEYECSAHKTKLNLKNIDFAGLVCEFGQLQNESRQDSITFRSERHPWLGFHTPYHSRAPPHLA